MTPSKILAYFCVFFILGIFTSSIILIPQNIVLFLLFLGIVLIIASLFVKKFSFILGFCLLIFILGILRFQISNFYIKENKLSKFNGVGEINITGVIIDEPDVRESYQRLKVRSGDGIILVTTDKYPEYKYLEKLKIFGKLETPMENEEFSYKNYLLKDGIYSVVGFPKIEIVGKKTPNISEKIYSFVLLSKGKIRESIKNNYPPPYRQVMQGILIGDKTSIPQDLKNKFSVTGVSHIIAVSGTHIVILGAIITNLLFLFGLSRKKSFYLTSIFIILYILLVGLPSSGVRAGIMGIIYLLAQYIGRQSSSSRLIILAGAIMLVYNPLLLIYDIGFQLSFIAVLGLIYLEPIIRYFLKILFNKILKIEDKYDGFFMMISATLSAQLFTLPIIIYNFGNISLISPIVNILLLPTFEALMFFGIISSLAGIFFYGIGWILSLPCYFLMAYFIWIVDVFSKNWAYINIKNVSSIWLFVMYLFIIFLVSFLNKKYSYKI